MTGRYLRKMYKNDYGWSEYTPLMKKKVRSSAEQDMWHYENCS